MSTQQEGATAMESDVSEEHRAPPVGSAQAATYGNDNIAAGIVENGNASDIHGSANMPQFEDGSVLSPEEKRLWGTVRTDFSDFNAWTALIEESEKMSQGNILKIRKAYDEFLAEFPLCDGYWKKYADHEANLGSIDKVEDVYERAVQALEHSVNMWLYYIVFALSTDADPVTIRGLFERGLQYTGSDYMSFPLWDKYLEYEKTKQAWSKVASIYTRILQNPNKQLERYFECFKELVASRPLSDLQTSQEAAAAAEAGNEQIVGEDRLSSEQSEPVNAAEELKKYLSIREEMYKKSKEFAYEIDRFETAITRPNFLAEPLTAEELDNWHDYLDFIEKGGDYNKVIQLYERCLIPCAKYPKYWIRYILHLKATKNLNEAGYALVRATQGFLKRDPEIHYFDARMCEQRNDVPAARAAYQRIHGEISPGNSKAIIRHANMERRYGNSEMALSIYEQAIASELQKENPQNLYSLSENYCRISHKALDLIERARNVQLSKPLLETLIHLESTYQFSGKRTSCLDSLVNKFISSPSTASFSEREEVSHIFLEYLDSWGDKLEMEEADHRHWTLFLHNKTKKRKPSDYLVSERNKRSVCSASSSKPSVIAAQNQCQTLLQATQEQPLQFHPGCTEQVTLVRRRARPRGRGLSRASRGRAYPLVRQRLASRTRALRTGERRDTARRGGYAPRLPSNLVTYANLGLEVSLPTAEVVEGQTESCDNDPMDVDNVIVDPHDMSELETSGKKAQGGDR